MKKLKERGGFYRNLFAVAILKIIDQPNSRPDDEQDN